ncbi:hypothetical protein PINS_up009230 [Pythium insidiosum]|nr:hypothetical protein PINS_up009230 [Pythium insidiosum]
MSALNDPPAMGPGAAISSVLSASPQPLAPAAAAVRWSDELSPFDSMWLIGLPLSAFVLAVVALRVIWRPRAGPKFRLPKQVPTYGTIDSDAETPHAGYEYDGDSNDLIYAGQVAGRYDTRWTNTFDVVFLAGMLVFALALVVLTCVTKPSLWTNGLFWLSMLPKLVAMLGVSTLGGIICRLFCIVDDAGYVLTERNSKFKVNYTRKLQLLAAYLIPLALKPDAACDCDGALELAWGDFVTLLAFLALIKPVRERSTFFMLQFNSLDRPEDRPHTLKWLVAGNVFPALFVLLLFRWLFDRTTQSALVFVLVFVTKHRRRPRGTHRHRVGQAQVLDVVVPLQAQVHAQL